MNDDELNLMLLQLIRVNGNVEYLRTGNLTYIEILDKIDSLLAKGFVQRKDSSIELTSEGEKYFRLLSKKLKRRGLYRYFMPNYEVKICQLQIDDVYLPDKSTIMKIGGRNN